MEKHFAKSAIAVLVIGAVVVFSVNAFAGRGYDHMGWGQGSQGRGYGPCAGQGYGSDMNEEDVKKMRELRSAFFEATSGLRQEMNQKRLALRSELAKKEPDVTVAKSLQKEISYLQAQFAEKRLDHMLEMKKINPHAGSRFMMGGGPGNRWMGGGPKGFGPDRGRGSQRGPWSGGQESY